MKRSFSLMLSALFGVGYLVYFGVSLFLALDGVFSWDARIAIGSHAFTMPYLIIHGALALAAVFFALIAFFRNNRACAAICGVLFIASAALLWYNAFFLLVQIILAFVGFSHLKQIRRQLANEDSGGEQAAPRPPRDEDEDPRASDGLTRAMTGFIFVVLLSVLTLAIFGSTRLPDVDQMVRDWMGVPTPEPLSQQGGMTPLGEFDEDGLFDDGEGEEFYPEDDEDDYGDGEEGEYDGALDDYGEPDPSLSDVESGGIYG